MPDVGGAASRSAATAAAQLFPHSDVDVLVLLPGERRRRCATAIERFFAALWDIGLELGHAVRTIDECDAEMAADVTVRTSLLEHRHLAGSRRLYAASFARAFAAALDVRAFYDAKVLEQQQRHLKYQDAVYNLEPNVKESPGGLRDLQTVLWIARAAGLGRTWRELARNGLMTHGRGARGVAPGAPHRRPAHSPALPRRAGARTGSCSTCRRRSRASSASPTRRRSARASS